MTGPLHAALCVDPSVCGQRRHPSLAHRTVEALARTDSGKSRRATFFAFYPQLFLRKKQRWADLSGVHPLAEPPAQCRPHVCRVHHGNHKAAVACAENGMGHARKQRHGARALTFLQNSPPFVAKTAPDRPSRRANRALGTAHATTTTAGTAEGLHAPAEAGTAG